MLDLKKLWDESRGNFVGGILAAAYLAALSSFSGFSTWAWQSYTSMQWPAKILGPIALGEFLSDPDPPRGAKEQATREYCSASIRYAAL